MLHAFYYFFNCRNFATRSARHHLPTLSCLAALPLQARLGTILLLPDPCYAMALVFEKLFQFQKF